MSWKKVICLLGAVLFADNAFGVCMETNYVLPRGGDASYDDYLYSSTAKYEKRNEGQAVRAYVCGQGCVGCCGVGETMRLSNAAIGSGAARTDAVYKCVNIPDADRTGYGWQVTPVDSYCTVGAGKFKYNSLLKLYEYNGMYCSEINEIKDLGTILGISNGDLIAIASSENITIQQVFNQIKIRKVKIKNKTMSAADFAKIKQLINKSENEIRQDLSDMGATIEGLKQDIKDVKGDVNALQREQFWDDIVNRMQNARLNRMARKLRDVKSELKTKVNEEQVMDLINDTIRDMELTDDQVAQIKDMITESARKTKMDINKINAKLRNMNWRITMNEAQIAWVRFYNNLRNDSQDRTLRNLGDKLADMEKEMLSEADVERLIESELKNAKLSKNQLKTVRTELDKATRGLNIKLNNLTKRIDELESEIGDIKTELTKQKVNAWFDRIKNNFINGVQDAKIKALGTKIDKLKKDIKERPTEDDVMDMIQNAIDEAELNDSQLAQVKDIINSEIESLGGDVQKLKRRVNSFQIKLAIFNGKLMWQNVRNNLQDSKIDRINKNLKKLESEIDDKATEEDVMDLIEKALDGAELSDAQTKQVEEMIRANAKKANARMDRIDKRMAKLTKRIRKVEWDVTKLKAKMGVLNAELDSKYALLKSKDKRLDKSVDKLRKGIRNVEKELNDKVSKDGARKMIQKAVDDAADELGADLSVEIQNEFNQIVDDLNIAVADLVGEIENRLAKIESDVAELQEQNERLINSIAGLQSLTSSQRSQINSLRTLVATKTTAEDVVALIIENTKSLSDGQKLEVSALIVEYTKTLSAGQKAQVESMIAMYVNPRINQINAEMDKMRLQEVARDKINSAMSVLNAFASSADVSVWKNAEGKFNTARLASDATAGVVLGTAGGLISNSIIRKNQIKKGFEDINCSVGGQVVSNYADEFMVGMQ